MKKFILNKTIINERIEFMKEFMNKYILIIYIALILIFPIIFTSLFSLAIKLGTTYMNTSEIIIDFNKPIDIGNYIEYYVTMVGIEATTVLSYMVYKTSVKSNELSEAINKKEENRDDDKIKESAIIIYYDLIGKITTLKLLYTKYKLKYDIEIDRYIFMPEDWVKNIANLRSILEKDELDILFNLYNKLDLISKNEVDNDKKVIKLIEKLSEELFIEGLLPYLWMNFKNENECLLNNKYYTIFYKIQKQFDEIVKKQKVYNGEIIDYKLVNGIEQWNDRDGNLIYNLEYENGKIIKGKFFNYRNNKYDKIFDGVFKYNDEDEDYKFTGYFTQFYKSKNIKYKGNMIDNKYCGIGILYNDNLLNEPKFSGEWDKGKMIEGQYKSTGNEGVISFKGKYKDNKPYTGEIECSERYNINGAYGFKGIIKEGKPINGTGYIKNYKKFTEKYLEDCPEEIDYLNDEEFFDPYEEIPDDVRQEMQEQDIRNYIEREKEDIEEHYKQIVELLVCKWNNGTEERSENDLINKYYYGIDYIK